MAILIWYFNFIPTDTIVPTIVNDVIVSTISVYMWFTFDLYTVGDTFDLK